MSEFLKKIQKENASKADRASKALVGEKDEGTSKAVKNVEGRQALKTVKKSKDENAKKNNDESEEEKISRRQEKKTKKNNMKKRTENNVEESEMKRRLLHSDGPVDDPSNNVLDDNTADHKSKKVKKMK